MSGHIRVTAMLIVPSGDGLRHLVSRNVQTTENPAGFHRLIGGGVEFGETHREAIIREVHEELGARILNLTHLGVVENIFHINGKPGHEIVALYSGELYPAIPDEGGTLTESDGLRLPVEWRPVDDADLDVPLYPDAAMPWIHKALSVR